MYIFEEAEKYREFFIIANRASDRFLIPEKKQADYFMVIKGSNSGQEKEEIIKNLKAIDMILAVFEIDPNQLKSKQNLLF